MKFGSKIALIIGLTSSIVFASEYNSPLDNVAVFDSELDTLSIQNFSSEKVEIDIYGELVDLPPASGVRFECENYENLELQIMGNNHDYFEVPCKSRVEFTESFRNTIN